MLNKIFEEDFKKISEQSLSWKKLRGKTILISGANGFIASYVIKFLFYLNDVKKVRIKIIGIARNISRVEDIFASDLKRPDFKIIIRDVSQPLNFKQKINFIIHAASQASPKYYSVDPAGTLKANILGTYNLLELATKNPVESFLFISAGEIYGKINKRGLTFETDYGSLDPSDVRSCYAESKRMGETMCIAWQRQYKVPVKIARLYHTYGPGIRLDDGRVFSDFVSNIVNNHHIVLKSDGKAVRSFVYVADTVFGLFTILLNGKIGEAYNLANEQTTVSIKKLAQILVELFPEKKLQLVFEKREKNDVYLPSPIAINKPSSAKLRNLGWKPGHSLAEGFLRTINSFK